VILLLLNVPRLLADEQRFQEFMREKARYWVSADTTEYDEVDNYRALDQGSVVSEK
jgi:hypothetical protein